MQEQVTMYFILNKKHCIDERVHNTIEMARVIKK